MISRPCGVVPLNFSWSLLSSTASASSSFRWPGIVICLGQDILAQAQARPGWRNGLEAIQERLTCRAERRAG
jgi:hypothetical protein